MRIEQNREIIKAKSLICDAAGIVSPFFQALDITGLIITTAVQPLSTDILSE